MDYRRRYAGRIWIGVFLLLAGAAWLLHQGGLIIPDGWYNWHLLLAGLGLFIGLARGFRGFAWLVIMAVGGVGLVQDYYTNIHIDNFIAPGVIILIGLALIFRRKRPWDDEWAAKLQQRKVDWEARQHQWHEHKREWRRQARKEWRNQARQHWHDTARDWQNTQGYAHTEQRLFQEDYIDTSTNFGPSRKKILSKDFKGGHVTTFMGHCEIDLTEADINGNVRLDITQVMGATRILVPATWEVRSDVHAVFAGFEDKRAEPAVTNPGKVLVIVGSAFFGGIEVRTQ